MDENAFWVKQIRALLIAFVTCVVAIASCTGGTSYYQTRRIANMASDGVDPLLARCAVNGFADAVNMTVCTQAMKGDD